MTYHRGSVMLTFTAYAIYWGPGSHAIPSSYEALIDRWFSDVGGTPFYNIVTQYYEGTPPTNMQNVSTFGGSWVDTVNPYPHAGTGSDPLTDHDIQAEVVRAIAANGWPNGGLNVGFFVFTAKGIESCASSSECTIGTANPVYCAYHSAFYSGSSDVIIYANMPYGGTWSAGFAHTCGNFSLSPNNNPDADMEISTTSHEHFEAVTDPLGGGWYDASGEEIGDKCAYVYGNLGADGHNVILSGNPYKVQEEWSNAAIGCALTYGSAAATPTYTPTSTKVPTQIPTSTPTHAITPTPTKTATPTPTRAGAPPNDACNNGTLVASAPYTGTVSTLAATTSSSDPTPSCGSRSRSRSVWYRFTAPRNGVVSANTSGTRYANVLSAYTGTCGSLRPVSGACSSSVFGRQPQIAFNAVAGTTYSFMISASSGSGGTAVFNLTFN